MKSDSDGAHNVSSEYNVSAIYTGTDSIPAGPYFVHRYTGDVYQAYRLYVDTSQAFIQVSSLVNITFHISDTASQHIKTPMELTTHSAQEFNPQQV